MSRQKYNAYIKYLPHEAHVLSRVTKRPDIFKIHIAENSKCTEWPSHGLEY